MGDRNACPWYKLGDREICRVARMNNHVLVWDLETIPDLPCVARVHGCPEGDDEAARQALGDKFPKLYLHKIACIGALIAERREGVWHVLSLGAPHMGERSEAEMLSAFVGRIAELRPQLIAWNCGGFDLPVLRYRGMINRDRGTRPRKSPLLVPVRRRLPRSLRRPGLLRGSREGQPERSLPSPGLSRQACRDRWW